MKVLYFFTAFLILLSISIISFGQETVEDENWLKGFNTEADYMPTLVYWDFERLSLKDIPQAKIRLDSVRKFTPQSETIPSSKLDFKPINIRFCAEK